MKKRWTARLPSGRRVDMTWLFRLLAYGWWVVGAVFSFAAVPVLVMLAIGDVIKEMLEGFVPRE